MTTYTARIEVRKGDFFQTVVKTANYLIDAETPEAAAAEAEGWRRCYGHGGDTTARLASLEPASEGLCQLVESTRRNR